MQKIIVTRGLPASGKSTWAKKLVKEDPKFIRVNKDDLRAMVLGGRKWKPQDEDVVVGIQTMIVERSLAQGLSVVVDDTNLNPSHPERFKQIAEAWGAQIEVKDFIVPVEELILRDSMREKKVGRDVIYNMGFQYGWLKQERPWIGVDLDGTLADITERRRISTRPDGKLDWGVFFDPKNIALDKPRFDVLDRVVTMGIEEDADIIILSGRSDRTRAATEDWLLKMWLEYIGKMPDGFPDLKSPFYNRLIMRRDGDNRPDDILKLEFLDRYTDASKLLCIYDDRNKVIRAWRSRGIEVIDVGTGEEF